jgi:hypothetical protein
MAGPPIPTAVVGQLRPLLMLWTAPQPARSYKSVKQSPRCRQARLISHGRRSDLSDIPAEVLRTAYQRKGIAPKHEQLAQPDLANALEALYADDARMFRYLMKRRNRRRQPCGGYRLACEELRQACGEGQLD